MPSSKLKQMAKTTSYNPVVIGVLILAVIMLFLWYRNQSKLHTTIDTMLDTVEHFQQSPPTPSITLSIKDASGTVELSNDINSVKFYKADDYHQIQITFANSTDFSNFVTGATLAVVLIDLNNKMPMDRKEYNTNDIQSNDMFIIDISTRKLIIKRQLIEMTQYNLILESSKSKPVSSTFSTGPNTFYYGIELKNTEVTNESDADNNLCLGIKVTGDSNAFTFNTVNANSIKYNNANSFSGLVEYLLRKPDMEAFKIRLAQFTFSNARDYAINKTDIEELGKYIPHKFDINLDFTRLPDDYPLEVIKSPDVTCSTRETTGTDCKLTLLNLRPEQTYTLKCRLVYIKVGSRNNFRSTPELLTTFTTPARQGTDPLDYLKQIKSLLLNVKQQSIDIKEFNEYQITQDKLLDTIEANINSKLPA